MGGVPKEEAMASGWGEEIFGTVLGGLPAVYKLVPRRFRQRAIARLNDVNPFASIAANEDLLHALRLAWIEAALQIDSSVVQNCATPEWAVKLMTQALAVELAKDGVRVNAIAPGVIETPMTSYTREAPERLDKFMLRTPMGRVGQPEELVGPVVFLASSMATYVTGVTLPVDGGFLAS